MKSESIKNLKTTIKKYNKKTKEIYMSDEMQLHFKKVLLSLLKELKEKITNTVNSLKNNREYLADENDRASDEQRLMEELNEKRRESILINKINKSLKLIDSGEFGFCTLCGEEIGLERLEARPTTTLCIECKMLEEIREKQLKGN